MSDNGRAGGDRVRFDLPHALVTLTGMADGQVEIEVWPKAGMSAFVVVDGPTARDIADALVRMAAAAEEPGPGVSPAGEDRSGRGPGGKGELPAGIIDLASRRRPPPRGA